MKRLRVLINPIAGHGLAPTIAKLIDSSPLIGQYEVDTQTTEYAGHAAVLAEEAVRLNYAGVIAVGGDGTVNEIAARLVNTSTALGIIPSGSGNGLARHLGYSLKFQTCLRQIATAEIRKIDTLSINNHFGLNVSGLGFDGFVAWRFNQEGKRGLSNYTRIALSEYFKYPSIRFQLRIDDKTISTDGHMLVIANASQFGNAAIIAPLAELNDGYMDIVTVKKPPLLQMPELFYRLFKGSLKESNYLKSYKCKSFQAVADRPVHLHVDGEAHSPISSIDVKINPLSLLVFMPQNDLKI
ncbi:MAG: diacylglycerol kinase family lipid kinase [Bacteroidetes bacterium]|nr:diacylglycerol kinase family lipid kinase [Bacteroidota bacterium]